MAAPKGGQAADENAPKQTGNLERSLTNALKRAKKSGTFIFQHTNMAKFPTELCDFVNYTPDGENWWDGNELTRIDLSRNEIVEIPAEIVQAATVQNFSLASNKLPQVPGAVFAMEALKVLDLSDNLLTALPEDIGQAALLCEFRATGNKLTVLPNSIGDCANLETLELSKNSLSTFPPSIGNLVKLTKLKLDENQIEVIPAFFGAFRMLKDLSMNKNKIHSVDGDALAPLSSLTMLDLSQNRLTALASTPKSESLDSLLLSFNQLETLENLDRCPNLTVLDLHNNKLKALPDSTCSLYHLKTLAVSNNELADVDPRISVLDSLTRIALEGNPLRSLKPAMRSAGAVELKKYLKNRMGDQEIAQEERKQKEVLKTVGGIGEEVDRWQILLREFV